MIMLLKDLRLSPMRSFLTGFSMFIGIIAVIASVLIGTVGKDYLIATNEQLNGRRPTYEITFSAQNFDEYSVFDKFLNRIESANRNANVMLQPNTGLLFSASMPASNSVKISKEYKTNNLQYVDAVYTTAGYNKVYNLPIVSGRWFSNSAKSNALEMVVNQSASKRYKIGEVAFITSRKTTQMSPIRIVGVVNDGVDSAKVYVNILGLLRYAPTLWEYSGKEAQGSIYWLNKENRSQKSIKSYVSDALYDCCGGQVNEIRRHDNSDDYENVITVLQLSFAIVAALLLFVSALGLINIGLASLEQRTHELLIRRALGATRWSIASLVLGSAIILALIVSIAAVAVSFGLVSIASSFWDAASPVSPPVYPYEAAIGAVIAAFITALAGSVVPAIKASRLQPALALR